jgi:hypothetical protein
MRQKSELNRRNRFAALYAALLAAKRLAQHGDNDPDWALVVEAEIEPTWDDIVVQKNGVAVECYQVKRQETDFSQDAFIEILRGIDLNSRADFFLVVPALGIHVKGDPRKDLRVVRELCRRFQQPGASHEDILASLRPSERAWLDFIVDHRGCDDETAMLLLSRFHIEFSGYEKDVSDLGVRWLQTRYPNSLLAWQCICTLVETRDGTAPINNDTLTRLLQEHGIIPSLDRILPEHINAHLDWMRKEASVEALIDRRVTDDRQKSMAISELLDGGSLFVVGPPGYGKSSLLRLALGHSVTAYEQTGLIPLLVDAEECNLMNRSLFEHSIARLSPRIPACESRIFSEMLHTGRAMLIIDNLRRSHERLTLELKDIIRDYPRVKLVVASRSSIPLPLRTMRLNDLSEEERLETIMVRLAVDENQARAIRWRFSPTLLRQASNPFLLGHIIDHYRRHDYELPPTATVAIQDWITDVISLRHDRIRETCMRMVLDVIAPLCVTGPVPARRLLDAVQPHEQAILSDLESMGILLQQANLLAFCHSLIACYICAKSMLASTDSPENPLASTSAPIRHDRDVLMFLAELCTDLNGRDRVLLELASRSLDDYLVGLRVRGDLVECMKAEGDVESRFLGDVRNGFDTLISKYFPHFRSILVPQRSEDPDATQLTIVGTLDGNWARISLSWDTSPQVITAPLGKNGLACRWNLEGNGMRLDGGRSLAAKSVRDELERNCMWLSKTTSWRMERVAGVMNALSQRLAVPKVTIGPEGLSLPDPAESERVDPWVYHRDQIVDIIRVHQDALGLCDIDVTNYSNDIHSLSESEWTRLAAEQRERSISGSPFEQYAFEEYARDLERMILLYRETVENDWKSVASELRHWPTWPISFEMKIAAPEYYPYAEVHWYPVKGWQGAVVSCSALGNATTADEEDMRFDEMRQQLADLGRPQDYIYGVTRVYGVTRRSLTRTNALEMAMDLLKADIRHLFRHWGPDFDIFRNPDIMQRMMPRIVKAVDDGG